MLPASCGKCCGVCTCDWQFKRGRQWATRQIENSDRNVAGWPKWMRDLAGIKDETLNTFYMRQAAQALLDEADALDAQRLVPKIDHDQESRPFVDASL